MRVQIVDPAHPHFPEHGALTGEVIVMRFSGNKMALMKLDACRHGTEACYVSPGQVAEESRIAPGRRKRAQ